MIVSARETDKKQEKDRNLTHESKGRKAPYDENTSGDMKTYLEDSSEKDVRNIFDIPGKNFYGFILDFALIGYNEKFRDHLKEYYNQFENNTHKCRVLKKIIRDVDPKTDEERVRVVYIFDEKNIKSFTKRVEKYAK